MVDDESVHQNESCDTSQTLIETNIVIDEKDGHLDELVVQNHPQTGKTITLDWDEPDDVDNPHNWPVWKKIVHSAIPAVFGFALCV